MKKNLQGLGARDDYEDDVDAFGLDQFGAARGFNPMWGAAIGSGLGTVTSIAVRQLMPTGRLAAHAEAVGFGVAGVAAGAMIAMKRTRTAGWTGLAAAFLNNGLRALEQYVMAPAPAAVVTPPTAGVVFEPTTAFQGLGIVDVEPTTAFQGALGRGEMPELVGSLQQASDHLQLVGGPPLNSFANNFGATLWGR